jgi:arylsulfatase A-like enzyme
MRILYIDIDSLRPDHLGCYGYHRNTSPNTDSVADNGRLFTNYYAADAPCLPSRTGLFTSRFGIHTGVINHGGLNADIRHRGKCRGFNVQHDQYRTWMSALRQAGHHTALVSPFPQRHGAWHILDGFDEWHDTGGDGHETADIVYPYAEQWLDEHATEDDWYLHVNFWDPHTQYTTPPEYGNPFADDPAPEWPTEDVIRDQYENGGGPFSARDLYFYGDKGDHFDATADERQPDQIASREDFQQWIDGYDIGIRYTDDYIGRLLDTLEEAGVREKTLIVITADHGEMQGELNTYGDHVAADDKTCRVPLIVEGPDIEPGVDDGLHYQLDLAPTVTELVDGSVPSGWDGQSFASSLTEGSDEERDYLVLSQGAWACQRSVRFDDWLLMRTYHDSLNDLLPVMLFNLADDPHETTNLARDRPEVVRRGLSLLQSWHDEQMIEVATDTGGGNPDSPRSATDPMWEVLHAGGPHHPEGHAESYAERLRETGRAEYADRVEEHEGYVKQSVEAYLRST